MVQSEIYSNPEFLDLKQSDISPFLTSCVIKVLYTGKNRNRTDISKEVATNMAKTLRGNPIVGYFKEEKDDFRDHGETVTFDDEGIHFLKKTRPYGFVAPDAKVWFQEYKETYEDGSTEIHLYLLTEGYLWTRQFEEAKKVTEDPDGRPHSMELDDETLQGTWANDYKTNINFFIVSDAIFSGLCILGKDVEPCFEGSNIKAASSNYTKELLDFATEYQNMIKEINYTLKGGSSMEEKNVQEVQAVAPVEGDFAEQQAQQPETQSASESPATPVEGGTEGATEFKKEEDKKEKDEKNSDTEGKGDESGSSENQDNTDEDEKKKKKEKDYSMLEEQFNELTSKYSELEKAYQELSSFKQSIELKDKQAMIDSFTMLSDEDKKDVVEHIKDYSLDDIEAKLSVIGKRKGVNFSKETKQEETAPAVTYNLSNDGAAVSEPSWLKIAREIKEEKKY